MDRPATRANPASVRHWNEYLVVEALRDGRARRIADLADVTGLTAAPLGQVIRGLSDKGWIEAAEGVSTGRGRPAQHYSLRVPPGLVLGLDVGAHACRAVSLDMSGEPIARHEVELEAGADARRDAVATVVGHLTSGGGVWLVGLVVGGTVDLGGTILRSVAVPDFDGTRPAELLGDVLPAPAVTINDVRAATLAEHLRGAAVDVRDVLVAHLGRRPTLGVLIGGEPRTGAHGTAGDLSLSPLVGDDVDWAELGAAARCGDRGRLDDYVAPLLPALALASSVVDPDLLVLAGAVTPTASRLVPDVAEYLARHVQRPPRVAVSPLDQFAAALGGALQALQEVYDRLSGPATGVLPLDRLEFRRRLGS